MQGDSLAIGPGRPGARGGLFRQRQQERIHDVKLRYVALSLGVAAIAMLALTSGAPVLAQNAATPAAAGGYKIGVVKFQEVVDTYEALKTQRDALQKEADEKATALKARKEAYDKKIEDYRKARETMDENGRRAKEDELRREQNDLKSQMDSAESDLNTKFNRLRDSTMRQILTVIRQIGANEGYHLILDANPEGLTGAVVYFAVPIDITEKVKEALKKSAPPAASGK